MNEFLVRYLGGIIFYLVSFFAALTALVPLIVKPSQIYNRIYRRWYKNLRWAGYLIIISALLGIYFNSLQNTYNDNEQARKLIALKDSLKKDNNATIRTMQRNNNVTIDTMQKNFIDGNKEIIKVLVKSLGVYGLKMDTVKNELKIVKDSSKTRVVLPDKPILILCEETGLKPNGEKGSYYRYDVNFCSRDAGSNNFKIVCKIALIDTLNNLKYIGNIQLINEEARISKDKGLSTTLLVPKIFPHKLLYVLVEGTYTSFGGIEKFPINELYYFNKNSDKTDIGYGIVIGTERKKVTDKIDGIN